MSSNKKNRKSLKLMRYWRLASRRHDTLTDMFACWAMKQKFHHEYTDSQRTRMNEASNHIMQAYRITKEVMQEIVGVKVIQEAEYGYWDEEV